MNGADDGSSRAGKRVLVVDDNRDSARMLSLILKLGGHDARTAFGGAEALEAVKTFTPDAVFLDISMPGMDGYETARRLRETPSLGGAFLVAMTGYDDDEDRRRSAEAGFDHHLVKPADPNAIASILRRSGGNSGPTAQA